MSSYTIKDLERLSGIKAHTIRIWEKRYGIIEPNRTDTNIRYYDDENLKKIINISILNNNGLKISKIALLSDQQISDKILEVSDTSDNYSNFVDRLVVCMIDLDEELFNEEMEQLINRFGFENTVLKVVYPFLEKIGVLWQIDKISPAQEHFISNLIRQKIIAAIDGLNKKPLSKKKTFLLFLKEGELHEIGLLFYSFIIKNARHKVIYLGQSVPYENLKEVIKEQAPDYLVTSFISKISKKNIEEYLNNLSEEHPTKHLFVTGNASNSVNLDLPLNVSLSSNIAEFKKEILTSL